MYENLTPMIGRAGVKVPRNLGFFVFIPGTSAQMSGCKTYPANSNTNGSLRNTKSSIAILVDSNANANWNADVMRAIY
jgi:hypothetical protein